MSEDLTVKNADYYVFCDNLSERPNVVINTEDNVYKIQLSPTGGVKFEGYSKIGEEKEFICLKDKHFNEIKTILEDKKTYLNIHGRDNCLTQEDVHNIIIDKINEGKTNPIEYNKYALSEGTEIIMNYGDSGQIYVVGICDVSGKVNFNKYPFAEELKNHEVIKDANEIEFIVKLLEDEEQDVYSNEWVIGNDSDKILDRFEIIKKNVLNILKPNNPKYIEAITDDIGPLGNVIREELMNNPIPLVFSNISNITERVSLNRAQTIQTSLAISRKMDLITKSSLAQKLPPNLPPMIT